MSEAPRPYADGTIDYSGYTAAQLHGVLQRIDAERYPLNFANAEAALAKLLKPVEDVAATVAPEAAPASSHFEHSVGFAPKTGFLTWLGPSRNDFRLVGEGSIAVSPSSLLVTGRRFGFVLGLPLRRRIELDRAGISNVEIEENVVRFEHRQSEGQPRSLTFWLADGSAAENLARQLPAARSPDFVPQLPAHLEFEKQLEARSPNLPVTYGFAALCVVMFAIAIFHGAKWFQPDGMVEIAWGSNYGPLTIAGQWWRLLSHALLHFGILHLTFNMWALVSFGAVAERLYGSLRFAFVCLVSAAAGGMTSIVMQPEINSAGASGVIFGILGSLLVAHLRGTEEIPPSVKRSLQGSTMFFATVALVVGFMLPGVDNAAHVGGLIAGICMGLAFHSPRPAVRFAAPAVFAAVIVAIGFALGQRSAAVTPAEAKYLESIEWFVGRENSAVSKWLEMVNLAKAKSISDTALADRLDNELVTFWREASQRFESVELEPGTELHNAHQYMRKLTSGRLHAIELCVSGLRTNDGKLIDRCIAEMQQGDELINARLKEIEEKK